MSDIYQKIEPRKISEEIVRQVKTLIREGQLRPGEKLPPERAFSRLLGVGRSSLREAMNILETTGFVEIRKRQGIFVRSLSTPLVSDPLRQILQEDNSTLPQLYELRKDIELASACLAAERRTDADLARIETLMKKMERGVETGGLSLQDDLDFHLAIAHATHNFLRVHVLKNIFDLSGEFLGVVLTQLSREAENLPVILEQHQRIFQAISARDRETAKTHMASHLTWVEKKWRIIWQEDG